MIQLNLRHVIIMSLLSLGAVLVFAACGDSGDGECDPELDGPDCVCTLDDAPDVVVDDCIENETDNGELCACFFDDNANTGGGGDNTPENVTVSINGDGFEDASVNVGTEDSLIFVNNSGSQTAVQCTGGCGGVTLACEAAATCGFGLDVNGNEDPNDIVLEDGGRVEVTFTSSGTVTFTERIQTQDSITVNVQ